VIDPNYGQVTFHFGDDYTHTIAAYGPSGRWDEKSQQYPDKHTPTVSVEYEPLRHKQPTAKAA
jgi:hypothetical protein